VGWLSAEGIIEAEPTECVLSTEPGYPPSPRYTAAVTEPSERPLAVRGRLPGIPVLELAALTTSFLTQMTGRLGTGLSSPAASSKPPGLPPDNHTHDERPRRIAARANVACRGTLVPASRLRSVRDFARKEWPFGQFG
jgi:hypothetical protein